MVLILQSRGEDVTISPQCADVLLIGGGIAGAVLAEAFFPLIVEDVMGFTLGGVLAESFAAEWQAGIGDVAEGSTFSRLQSISAGGSKGDYIASAVKVTSAVLTAPLALLCKDLCPAIDKSLIDISLAIDESGKVVKVAWDDIKTGTEQTWDRIEQSSRDVWKEVESGTESGWKEVESGTESGLRNVEDEIYWMWYKSNEQKPSSDSMKLFNLPQIKSSPMKEGCIMLYFFGGLLLCIFLFVLCFLMYQSYIRPSYSREYQPLLSHFERGIYTL